MAMALDALASYLQDMLLEMAKEEVHLLLGVPNEIKKDGHQARGPQEVVGNKKNDEPKVDALKGIGMLIVAKCDGFVHGNSHDVEVSGKEYYDQLIARNLLEPNPRYLDQEVCNMHDVVRSFAQYLARDEAIAAYKSEASPTNKINTQNIIRLSIKTKESEPNELAWSSLQAHISLRTLILVGEIKISQAYVEGDWCSLEELGSLNIHGLENVSSSSFAIKARLGVKVHLSYLCLQCTSTHGGAHWLVKQEEQQQIEKVFDELCPPPCLENLEILGNWVPWKLEYSKFLTMDDLPYCTELPDGLYQLPSLEFLQIKNAPGIKRVGSEFLLPHHHDLKIWLDRCHGLGRISNLPILQNLVIIMCPEVKVLEGLPALQRLALEDYDVETLPGYLKDVNPRLLDLYCDVSLLACIAKRESGPEWDKFSHIKQVKA
ncbi:unnamed protein product [Miscanthus lutarioriparius]|uniref:R13L1/DRL21-like LRR repeat region domain-containing protein n=1 Tax=Miscanthus lutarioriparius TaxID=422564 RepID=A0A811QFA4_9POAL|nr:unnamed protein product [Miscanthus lutarioriparius]